MTDTECIIADHTHMRNLVKSQLERALKVMNDLANAFANDLITNWEKAGGCTKCEGTQRVLTWSTPSDGSSYDEFGSCPDCTDISRKAGKKPGVWGPRGTGSRNGLSNLELAKQEFPLGMKDVVEQYEIAKANHFDCVERQLDKQDYIIVLKGRKVPVGDHGVVVGFSHNQWGSKVGFVNAEGKTQWTAVGNVERCLGMDGATKRGAIEAYVKSTNEYRKSKGLQPSNVTVEMLLNK